MKGTHWRRVVVAVLCLLALAGAAAPALAGHSGFVAEATGAQAALSIERVDYVGDGAINETTGLSLWQDESHAFEVALGGEGDRAAYEICLAPGEAATACRTPAESGPVTFTADGWPGNATGEQTLSVTLREADTGDVVDEQDVTVTVRRSGGDVDGDGLTNAEEVERGTDLATADTDGDGLSDGTEVTSLESDPLAADTDGDGLSDGREVNDLGTSPVDADTDGDGLGDERESRPGGPNPNKADTDGDGLTDAEEVSTYGTDPTSADTDGDSVADGTEISKYNSDPLSADTDGDGLSDGREAHVLGTSLTSADTDSDGLSDRREAAGESDPTVADTDEDGLADGAEVNTYDTSPIEADTDGDGFTDGREVSAGTDPTDTDDHPKRTLLGTLLRLDLPLLTTVVVALAGGLAVVGLIAQRSATLPDPPAWIALESIPSSPVPDPGESATEPASGAVSADEAADEDAPSDGDQYHLLTNREQVTRILEDNDGRLHQSEIVETTAWSKSKVSRVLSRMEDDGQLSKIPLGKENLIALPGEEPDGAKSPHDEE